VEKLKLGEKFMVSIVSCIHPRSTATSATRPPRH
jgi:hypothetical protein